MNGKLHMKLGMFVGISSVPAILMQMNSQPFSRYVAAAGMFAVGTTIGSLVPDIDTPTSTISKGIPLIPSVINKLFGHRGFLHSPCFVILIWLLQKYLCHTKLISIGMYGIIVGCIAHLVQDIFTKGGIPILYPFSRKKISLGFFKSGSKADPIITTGIGIAWIFFLSVYLFPLNIFCQA